MRILIVTQNENIYLPSALAKVCLSLMDYIACVVTAPPMSTHGGILIGILKHFQLFGFEGMAVMAWRMVIRKSMTCLPWPSRSNEYLTIKRTARTFGIPYYHVNNLKSENFLKIVYNCQADLLISLSCPQIIDKKTRNLFSKGCVNVHSGPLPRYRGLMPTFWVLRNGESKTAVTVHDLAAKLDDGDIIVQHEVHISPDDTWDSLLRKTKAKGAEALIEAVERLRSGNAQRRPNPEEQATYFSFPKLGDRKAFLASGRRFF